MDLELLVKNHCVLGCFPMHNPIEKVTLQKQWLVAHQFPWNQPLWGVKSYFGENVALFFAFVGHLNGWFIAPAVFGIGVYINMATANSYTVISQFWFGLFLAIWATGVLEFWKRKEVTYAMMWGMSGFEKEEDDRPEFEGVDTLSPIDGEDYKHFPDKESYKSVASAYCVLLGVVAVLTGVFASLFALSAFVNMKSSVKAQFETSSFDVGQLLSGCLCTTVILVCSNYFHLVAKYLTDKENHRTDSACVLLLYLQLS